RFSDLFRGFVLPAHFAGTAKIGNAGFDALDAARLAILLEKSRLQRTGSPVRILKQLDVSRRVFRAQRHNKDCQECREPKNSAHRPSLALLCASTQYDGRSASPAADSLVWAKPILREASNRLCPYQR